VKIHKQIERILVPVPLNRDMMAPIRQAMYFHEKYRSEIVILHVVHEYSFLEKWLSSRILKKHRDKAKVKLFFLLSKLFPDHPILDHIEFEIVTGNLISSILRVAAKRKSDLIIIKKAFRAKDKAHRFKKENADKLISDSLCPVMTIVDKSTLKGISSILLPVDITKKSDKKVRWAISLAKKFGASIHVVSVQHLEIKCVHSLSYNKGCKIKQEITQEGIDVELVMLKAGEMPLEEVVLDYAKKLRPDLILIMTHKETILFDNYLGSFAREIIHKAEVPVISIIPQKVSLFTDMFKSGESKEYLSTENISSHSENRTKTKGWF